MPNVPGLRCWSPGTFGQPPAGGYGHQKPRKLNGSMLVAASAAASPAPPAASAAPPAASAAPPAASDAASVAPPAASVAPPAASVAASVAPPAASEPNADSPVNASPGSSSAVASKSVGMSKLPNGVTSVSVMELAEPSSPGTAM